MALLYSSIVVPYDHSALSKKALKYAINLASEDEKIKLSILMVVQPEVTYSYRVPRQNEAQHAAVEEIRNEVEQELKELPNKTQTYVLRGNPAQHIVDFTKENGGDFIVMGSRGLSGLKEAFLGSVSHHVVQRATCPVLVVK